MTVQLERQVVCQVDIENTAYGPDVGLRLARIESLIDLPAVVVVVFEGNTSSHAADDSAPNRTLYDSSTIVAGVNTQVSVKCVGGLFGNEMHEPAGGVAAEQSTLRPTQNFDALQIE